MESTQQNVMFAKKGTQAKPKILSQKNLEIDRKNKDTKALVIHYKDKHSNNKITRQKDIAEAYKVTFLEKPKKVNLDTAENHWISKLDAKINIMKTFLPKYK